VFVFGVANSVLMVFPCCKVLFKRITRSKKGKSEDTIIRTLQKALLESAKEGGEVRSFERVI